MYFFFSPIQNYSKVYKSFQSSRGRIFIAIAVWRSRIFNGVEKKKTFGKDRNRQNNVHRSRSRFSIRSSVPQTIPIIIVVIAVGRAVSSIEIRCRRVRIIFLTKRRTKRNRKRALNINVPIKINKIHVVPISNSDESENRRRVAAITGTVIVVENRDARSTNNLW